VASTVEDRDLSDDLQRWARAHCGEQAQVRAVARLPGHAGISFRFDVVGSGRPGALERLVIRLAPARARRVASTDVVRQVAVLRAMAAVGVPVPRVRWWGDDARWFGVSYLVVDHVEGVTLPDVFDPAAAAPAAPDVSVLFDHAVDVLAAIHGPEALAALRRHPEPRPEGWSTSRSLAAEIDMWMPVVAKAEDRSWVDAAGALRRRLLASAPGDPEPRVVHGDFYCNNWLVDKARVTAVLDWENASVGAPLLDVGWLCMIHDPACWGRARTGCWAWLPPVETILSRYEGASGRTPEHPSWYEALAAYRMACIAANGLRLHRSGRHPDPIWEVFGNAFGSLIARGDALLGRPD
jgi:aminoglycoside phosphotransferase (APT) family kinase protein